MKFKWTVVYEAEDKEEAEDLLYNEQYGAIQNFGSIYEDSGPVPVGE